MIKRVQTYDVKFENVMNQCLRYVAGHQQRRKLPLLTIAEGSKRGEVVGYLLVILSLKSVAAISISGSRVVRIDVGK